MASTTSLQEVVEGPRLLPGEEHLRSSSDPMVSKEAPAEQPTTQEPSKVKEGEQSATPAQTETKTTPDKPADDDLWSDPPETASISRDVYVATRKKWRDRAVAHERELAELRGRLQVYEQQRQTPVIQKAKEEPEDDDARAYAGPGKFAREVAKTEAQAVAIQTANTMHNWARRQMARQHSDFAEAEAAFLEVLKADPSMATKLQAATANGDLLQPEFAYEQGKQILRVKKMGVNSIDELEEKLRKEAEEKAEAKYRKQSALAAAEQASTSSAGARGSGATSSPVFSGPTPLKRIAPGAGL